MADIWGAFRFLNETHGIGLTDDQLLAADLMYKEKLLSARGFDIKNTIDTDKWEAFVHVQPHAGSKMSAMKEQEFDELKKSLAAGAAERK